MFEINTTKLRLRYTGGAFSAGSLSIAGDGGSAWRPGSAGRGNLNGTFTSKDCGGLDPLTVERCIHKWQGMMQPGLLTRDFGVLVRDFWAHFSPF